jgi:deoxyribodipyrimidine photo-lyase
LSEAPVIVWFRGDLRLADNLALTESVATGAPILPLYILDDETPDEFRAGGASRWWLHGSLASLASDFRTKGGALCLRRGNARDVLAAVLDETHAQAVHATRLYDPWDVKLADSVAGVCKDRGVTFRQFSGGLLFEPEDIHTGDGAPYRIFTPFWKACQAAPPPRAPLAQPRLSRFTAVSSDALDDWRLLPTRPDWAAGLRETWSPGEADAAQRLKTFIDHHLANYDTDRDRIDLNATSLLSPSLHFGEISPNQIWHAVEKAADGRSKTGKGAYVYLRELGWREFCHQLLFYNPRMATEPLRPEFARFPWRDDPPALSAWQRGETGYPIVDAAMRDLWHTGFMPNRARLVVASFLVKHLLIPWQDGAAWFLDTLVDADLADNQANWQWVSGCGADAAPYFRIFNPILQGKKFDPDGAYVRKWVPELADLPASDIHAPWEAPAAILAAAGVVIGKTYPAPIVDHAAARARALTAFETVKSS